MPSPRRSVVGDTSDVRPRGEEHPNAKLTNAQVLEIRRLYDESIVRVDDIASDFGVSSATVRNIGHRYQWKHI
jgi:DNA invertase Pin-like site-specific DNA recombinase